ncbi:TniQ family protein [Ralstonia flaminis]|jgi:hypothetical protein|uniref:TniQ domain-containing protein n=1 Tax=Ralstonia flaminis TaxID=3058597 RepID=A0ABN9JE98_9RALS|nr:TniQ family protein [Ralstonia sp. LMG 18101]CAJ0809097.1 hypothetical protein LMG18101_00510 [Ralstonia sp. LMG 18101]
MNTSSIMIAPDPLPDESAASWIQRTCQLHGVTYKQLATSLGVKRCFDPDLTATRKHLCRIAEGTGIPFRVIEPLADSFKAARTHPAVKQLLNFDGKIPAYRFCPKCLVTDRIPYLRTSWRIKGWTICPEHRVKMLERCPTCNARIRATEPCLGVSGETVLGIDHCAACCNPLATPTGSYPEVWLSPTRLRIQQTFLSAARRGVFGVKGYDNRLSVEFLLWLKANPDVVKQLIFSSLVEHPRYGLDYHGVESLVSAYCLERTFKIDLAMLLKRPRKQRDTEWDRWVEKCTEATLKRRQWVPAAKPVDRAVKYSALHPLQAPKVRTRGRLDQKPKPKALRRAK